MQRAFLVGQRLYLRPLDATDVTDDYVGWLNDPEVTTYLQTGRFPSTRESVREFLHRFHGSATDFIFGIVDREADRHIGNVTLNRVDWLHRTADTGLLIGDKSYWGRGYAREAWGLVIQYAFARLELRKLVAVVIVDNKASLAALRKLGFTDEGRFRQEYLVDGQYLDAVRLGLLREEFRPVG